MFRRPWTTSGSLWRTANPTSSLTTCSTSSGLLSALSTRGAAASVLDEVFIQSSCLYCKLIKLIFINVCLLSAAIMWVKKMELWRSQWRGLVIWTSMLLCCVVLSKARPPPPPAWALGPDNRTMLSMLDKYVLMYSILFQSVFLYNTQIPFDLIDCQQHSNAL